MIYVKPAPGLRIRDPVSKVHLPEAGRLVAESSHWNRRIRAGDVLVSDPPVVVVDIQIPDSKE